jgi:hypothetical protein
LSGVEGIQGCIKPLSWIKPSMVEDELSGHLLS